MRYSIEEINTLINGEFLNSTVVAAVIRYPVFDSRMSSFENESIFFALAGQKSDGHQFISAAYHKGIRSFVVSEDIDLRDYPDANFIKTDNTLQAFQLLAQAYRKELAYTILAIAGSNGKTIVKEWLYQALSAKYKVGKTPLSYNSQIGVPYSMLSLDPDNDLGIIEAGISQTNEMELLEKMIRPQVGIFTNLGDAHAAGFESREQKLEEKALLFQGCKLIILSDKLNHLREHFQGQKLIVWGEHSTADIQVVRNGQSFTYKYDEKTFIITTTFTSDEMLENFHHVVSYLIIDGWNEQEVQQQADLLATIPNRLEIRQGVDNSIIINDSYSSDLASVKLALEFLDEKAQGRRRVVVISDFDEKHESPHADMKLLQLLYSKNLDELYLIGLEPSGEIENSSTRYYPSTKAFLDDLQTITVRDSFVLVKGAQKYKLDEVVSRLSRQVHQTRLEIDLNAIGHNINVFRRSLKPETKIMAVVKASAYGSGSEEMVRYLESRQVDQLAVALIDEAVDLRKNGCNIPVMIFNVQQDQLDALWEYDLEPEVYSFSLLNKIIEKAKEKNAPIKIHLKLDSGMHRLGFMSSEIDRLVNILKAENLIEVYSIFSHLASSGNPAHDAHTHKQVSEYELMCERLIGELEITPMRHILNSSGIVRFPEYQYDMVRLGLGMYGIDETGILKKELRKAHHLKAQVLQLKSLDKGAHVGYERKGEVDEKATIAVISLGYADGLIRQCGNGNYTFLIDGKVYPTIGNVCMDVSMILLPQDSTIIEGTEVTIFSPEHPVEALAKACGTITYEILSRVAPRVKRTYVHH